MTPLIVALALSFGGDAATTHIALSRGATEQVLFTQNPYVVDGIIAGEMALTMVALTKLHHTHPKLAKALGWGAVGMRTGVAAHNWSVSH